MIASWQSRALLWTVLCLDTSSTVTRTDQYSNISDVTATGLGSSFDISEQSFWLDAEFVNKLVPRSLEISCLRLWFRYRCCRAGSEESDVWTAAWFMMTCTYGKLSHTVKHSRCMNKVRRSISWFFKLFCSGKFYPKTYVSENQSFI